MTFATTTPAALPTTSRIVSRRRAPAGLTQLVAAVALWAGLSSGAVLAEVGNWPAGTDAVAGALAHSASPRAAVIIPPATALPVAAVGTAAVAPAPVAATLPPAFVRWQSSMAAFAKADTERHPGNDGVLFVGSSTIRMWTNLQQDFRQVPVIINRGFGGSTMADCDFFARELVTQYKPKQVLVYAGDNDLAEGRSPSQVLDSFAHFVRSVRAELPGVKISYISIKPSPSRLSLMPKIRETNALISDYVQAVPDLRYIDIFNPMLGADGMPRAELFLGDRLHMNDAGYQIWQNVIAAHLPAANPALPVPQLARARP